MLETWQNISAASENGIEAFPRVVSIDGIGVTPDAPGNTFIVRFSSPVRARRLQIYKFHHGESEWPEDATGDDVVISIPAYCATRDLKSTRWEVPKVDVEGGDVCCFDCRCREPGLDS